MVEQGEGTAVQCAVGDDMLASTCDSPQGRGDSAHAGSGGDTSLATLKSGYLVFENGCGWVAEAGVDVTGFLTGEAVTALLAAIEHEGRGLEYGSSQSAVLSVLDITCVDGLGAKAILLIIHCISS